MYRLSLVIISRSSFYLAVTLAQSPPNLPIVYPKTTHAKSRIIIVKNYSDLVLGTTSPYPTVVMVLMAKYTQFMYFSVSDISTISDLVCMLSWVTRSSSVPTMFIIQAVQCASSERANIVLKITNHISTFSSSQNCSNLIIKCLALTILHHFNRFKKIKLFINFCVDDD